MIVDSTFRGLLEEIFKDRSIAAALALVDRLEQSGDTMRACAVARALGQLAESIDTVMGMEASQSVRGRILSLQQINQEWTYFETEIREIFWAQTATHAQKMRLQRLLNETRAYEEKMEEPTP